MTPGGGYPIASERSWSNFPNSLLRGAAEGLFSVLFPSECRICGLPLLNISRLPVCPDCLGKIHAIPGKVCSICGERVLSSYAECDPDGMLRCTVCRRVERPFFRAVAYGSYDGGLRDLIHLLKYNIVRPAANVLGRMLAEALVGLEPEFGADSVLVVPVPLYKGKQRQRGFNQAALIAAQLARRRKIPVLDAVRRVRATSTQTGLTNAKRRDNVRGAFRISSLLQSLC